MRNHLEQLRDIFTSALELPSGQERNAYLDKVCGSNSELRGNRIPSCGERGGGRLLPAPAGATGSGGTFVTGGSGTRVHRSLQDPRADRRRRMWRSLRRGTNGAGAQAVALKIVKLGMDTKSVIARFEAERQALAMMDHPDIAKVLDAGATDTGRPYFVMELVPGTAITTFSDQNNLSTRDRLDLFIKVCGAIQHAHQKGIIHRDIKPSNILVTLHDGVPVPRVIDFGIAKAIEGPPHRRDHLYATFAVHWHAGLHEPGTGGAQRPGYRHPLGMCIRWEFCCMSF